MYRSRVFNVMLASPGDVATERRTAKDVIHEWNSLNSETARTVLMPVGWETHSSPLLGDRPQAIINKQVLERSDLLVAIFWTRLGTATGAALSGTVEEIEWHMKSGRPTMLYFSAVPVAPESVDLDQLRALKEFKKSISTSGLFESYESISEFREKFARQLAHVIKTHSYFRKRKTPKEGPIESSGASPTPVDANPIPPPQVDPLSRLVRTRSKLSAQLSSDAAELLAEAAKDEAGMILRIETFGGLEISTHDRNFIEEKNARSEARWEEALAELVSRGLISDKGGKGEIFGITNLGYQMADSLGR